MPIAFHDCFGRKVVDMNMIDQLIPMTAFCNLCDRLGIATLRNDKIKSLFLK